jgi:hypothetical protein
MKNIDFWDRESCNMVTIYRRFEGTDCLDIQVREERYCGSPKLLYIFVGLHSTTFQKIIFFIFTAATSLNVRNQ